ncbi:hypothetical protein Tco_1282995 [Tanacetum coccineum]|uniref:Uncharacterized protein n=1 Tax=Tanacetum coccineum TaxID=301880 RepID=A0ABQ5EKQ0_9ASTR
MLYGRPRERHLVCPTKRHGFCPLSFQEFFLNHDLILQPAHLFGGEIRGGETRVDSIFKHDLLQTAVICKNVFPTFTDDGTGAHISVKMRFKKFDKLLGSRWWESAFASPILTDSRQQQVSLRNLQTMGLLSALRAYPIQEFLRGNVSSDFLALWESGKYLKSHRGNNRMGFRESFRAILVMKGSGKWYLVRVASFKLSVVDAHSPPCVQSCRIDHFPAIFDNGHATLLWYTMHRAYPWTVRDWINQSGVKKLFNFFLDDVVDFWIYPPLDACENRLVISPLP